MVISLSLSGKNESVIDIAEHYWGYTMKYKTTMRFRRESRELLEVDWAVTMLSVLNSDSGRRIPVYVFFVMLPYSHLSIWKDGSHSELSYIRCI